MLKTNLLWFNIKFYQLFKTGTAYLLFTALELDSNEFFILSGIILLCPENAVMLIYKQSLQRL